MNRELLPPQYPQPLRDVVATAVGAMHRDDPSHGRGGGPAGNAVFTAWLGITLLVLFFAEGVTLIAVHQLISAHILIGTVLVPLALLKTATTGWRMVRYYTGSPAYRQAGPPPLILRILGPLVVLTAIGVLGTGLALVALGAGDAFRPLVSAGPWQVNALTLHQAAFIAWLVATGLHVLTRTIPALQLVAGRTSRRRALRGTSARVVLLALAVVVGVGAGVAVLQASTAWTSRSSVFGHDDGG